ncbi:MAG TPA: calcium-binding protein, partial [Allosphingosinicella sp.]
TQATIFVLTDTLENLRAASDIGHDFRGNGGHNVIVGGNGNDIIRAQDGGDDLLFGKDGVDSFYFGGAFGNGDLVDGGDNRDSLILQGDYAAGLTLTWNITGGSSIVNIESISLISGTSTQYGQAGTSLYSYNLTLVDGNVAAGALMKINGFSLQAGENFTLDASAESDAPLQVYAGFGVDTFTGGQQGDAFIFGHDGRFGAGDSVNGGGGYDVVYLRGDYAIDFNAAGFQNALVNVESIAILTSANNEFAGGGDGDFDYTITWADALLAAGATFTVNASRLQAHETFVFDGSQETNGVLRVFGGASADTLTGGGGADQLHGGGGADVLRGGGGADLFRYSTTGDSTGAATDTIHGFTAGTDKIDVIRVDARAGTPDANESFAFIGAAAFSASGPNGPGELRAFNVSGDLWQVEGDVNGDGIADLVIEVHVEAGQPLAIGDFLL